ncbi:hypothetical protein F6X40_23885 [Paraburkholderia sp. UCT31]|uniref:hypothetical protein n=1 Tax=Paraburkholderia sp. UCT31 TaxID=2615209 RepID=UPI00165542A9|nr:hypothetical protein [Paraburkholderia sp. UCT31]MBC8739757.1 hypothetical protein [Paraburkholderia sp. UCT31]
MKTTLHDVTFAPYPDTDGAQFRLVTWYGGVAIDTIGQSRVKVGYSLTQDGGAALFETPAGEASYLASPNHPVEGPHTPAHLMAYLTSEFILLDAIDAEADKSEPSAARLELLKAFQAHLGPLWDCVVARYGVEVVNTP